MIPHPTPALERVCEMNFVVTKPYMTARGAYGDFSNVALTDFYQMPYGTQVFSASAVKSMTDNLDATTAVQDGVNKLVDTYSKLAVTAGEMKLNARIGAQATTVTVKKVPSKDIYFFAANDANATITINDKEASLGNKPFTIIVTKGHLVVKGNITKATRGMYIVTNGNITISPDVTQVCDSQKLMGIYIASNPVYGIKAVNYKGDADTMHNTSLTKERCSKGDLTVQGILIGKGAAGMYNIRRSNANDWFNGDSTNRKEDILNHGAVVLKYNPDIFDHLPPGADALSQALSVYKK